MIKDVTDLEVYNISLDLLEQTYKLSQLIPINHKRLKYQLTEAAEKIAPQIAEGFGKKRSPKEFCRFLSMALGSSDEVITHLKEVVIIAKTYYRINIDDCNSLIDSHGHSPWSSLSSLRGFNAEASPTYVRRGPRSLEIESYKVLSKKLNRLLSAWQKIRLKTDN